MRCVRTPKNHARVTAPILSKVLRTRERNKNDCHEECTRNQFLSRTFSTMENSKRNHKERICCKLRNPSNCSKNTKTDYASFRIFYAQHASGKRGERENNLQDSQLRRVRNNSQPENCDIHTAEKKNEKEWSCFLEKILAEGSHRKLISFRCKGCARAGSGEGKTKEIAGSLTMAQS